MAVNKNKETNYEKKHYYLQFISALCATSVQAANLYDAEGTSVNLSGEVDAFYKTSTSKGFTEEDDKGNDVEVADEDGVLNTWANVQFDIATEVSESVDCDGFF